MMKPIIYVALNEEGHVIDARHRHPISPPQFGGAWSVYVAAGRLEELEAEIEQLKLQIKGEGNGR